jgi:hypothetical protein
MTIEAYCYKLRGGLMEPSEAQHLGHFIKLADYRIQRGLTVTHALVRTFASGRKEKSSRPFFPHHIKLLILVTLSRKSFDSVA